MESKENLEKELQISVGKLESYSDVLAQIKGLNKKIKDLKEKLKITEPQYKETEDETILSLEEVPYENVAEMINKGVKEHTSPYIHDVYYDETIEDDGLDHTGYSLIGSKLYEFNVHYDSRWEGEWSMRCNVIETGSEKISGIKEIPTDKFEITYNDKEVGQIFNAKIQIN